MAMRNSMQCDFFVNIKILYVLYFVWRSNKNGSENFHAKISFVISENFAIILVIVTATVKNKLSASIDAINFFIDL